MWLKHIVTVVLFSLGSVAAAGMYCASAMTGEDEEYQALLEEHAALQKRTDRLLDDVTSLEVDQLALRSNDVEVRESIIWQVLELARPDDIIIQFKN
ncbi:hypothetical protein KBA39_10200 [Myxococcota bacterium]|nr:hypothetical protein [Myxococcota bacterium]